jgi:DNA-binding transcriptional regulator YhcF (GntR family)
VARAYRELEAEGLVITASRAGTVVAPGAQRDDVALRRAAAAFVARATVSQVPEDEAVALVREAFRNLRE